MIFGYNLDDIELLPSSRDNNFGQVAAASIDVQMDISEINKNKKKTKQIYK